MIRWRILQCCLLHNNVNIVLDWCLAVNISCLPGRPQVGGHTLAFICSKWPNLNLISTASSFPYFVFFKVLFSDDMVHEMQCHSSGDSHILNVGLSLNGAQYRDFGIVPSGDCIATTGCNNKTVTIKTAEGSFNSVINWVESNDCLER